MLVSATAGAPFRYTSKESMHVVGRNGKPAASVQSPESDQAQEPHGGLTIRQNLIAKAKMIRCSNDHVQPPVRQPLINRLDFGKHRAALWIGHLPAVIAEKEHAGLAE